MTALLFLLGTVLGSFLNVCIYRIPREMSVIRPASQCPHCGASVRPLHNVPIVGYLVLRGKCAECTAPISPRYPAVELLTGLLTAAAFLRFGLTLEGGVALAILSLLTIIAFIDAEHLIIPDSLLIIALGAALFGGFLLTAGAAGKLLFKKEALGFGDVKLGAVLGAFLGWKLTIVSLYGAFLLAAVYGVAGLVSKKIRFGEMVPFGPFLAAGGAAAIFWGDEIITLFVRWMLS